ncbi:hypothetical protein, partial [Enterococcus thailandicus]|uniref:hypothetical protein n=1 Tax=Enterococcus thailandicus TaxID=417368 RepID=UPI0022EBD514
VALAIKIDHLPRDLSSVHEPISDAKHRPYNRCVNIASMIVYTLQVANQQFASRVTLTGFVLA